MLTLVPLRPAGKRLGRGWQRTGIGEQFQRRATTAGKPADHERTPALRRVKHGRQHAGVVTLNGAAVRRIGDSDDPVPGRTRTRADSWVTAHNRSPSSPEQEPEKGSKPAS